MNYILMDFTERIWTLTETRVNRKLKRLLQLDEAHYPEPGHCAEEEKGFREVRLGSGTQFWRLGNVIFSDERSVQRKPNDPAQ